MSVDTLAPPMSAAPAVMAAPTEPLVPIQPRRSGPSAISVAVWSMLGLAAAGYLYVAASNPALLPDLSQSAVRGETTRAETAPPPASEDHALRETVTRLQAEVTRLTANVIASEERAAQLTQKLAQIESTAASQTASAEPPAPGAAPAPQASAPDAAPSPEAAAIAGKFAQLPPAPKAGAKATPATAKVADAAARAEIAASEGAAHGGSRVKVINTAQQRADGRNESPIETGSITPPPAQAAAPPQAPDTSPSAPANSASAPISFGAAVVTPAPRAIGVQIASGDSVEALRQAWGELSILHSDSLKALQPRYVTGKTAGADAAGGERFDLVVGPIRNAAQAKRTCRTLQSRGVACHVADFDGNAL